MRNSITDDIEKFPAVVRLRPSTTAAQVAARREADLAMSAQYAGHHVAYVDTWAGDVLNREVVAFSDEIADFHDLLVKLLPDVRSRVQLTYLTPADTLFAHHARLG